MPQLSEICYSREECISAIRGYYHFLTKLYLNESDILEPPAEGWPDITATTMQGLGKTDEVVSLLRHLPYIRDPKSGDMRKIEAAGHSHFADWQDIGHCISNNLAQAEDEKLVTESVSLFEIIPPHVISLTGGGQELFFLDTELGIAMWHECPGDIKYSPSRETVRDDPYDYEEDEAQAEWRGSCTAWTVPDFFEILKDQFLTLQFIPLSHRIVSDVYTRMGPRSAGMREMVQEIYRRHGWPDVDKYRKADCLKAVHEALKEHYPDHADA